MKQLFQERSQPRIAIPKLLRARLVLLFVLLTAPVLVFLAKFQPSREAWEEYKRAAFARGDSLEWSDQIPLRAPSEVQNFAATPLLRKIGRKGQGAAQEFWAHVNSTGLRDKV